MALSKSPRVLLFDDDESFAETYGGALSKRGFDASHESSPHKVRTRIQDKPFDAILLDVELGNSRSDDYNDGIDVLMDIVTYSKKSQVLVLSGPGTAEQVATCLKLGCCDFISKESLMRGGVELLHERIMFALEFPELRHVPDAVREKQIGFIWANIKDGSSIKRGRRLEQLMKLLFESLPGFDEVRTDFKIPSQQIDLVIIQRNSQTFWNQLGGQFLAECKNWSSEAPPGSDEFSKFWAKLVKHRALGKLGFFVSLNGFTDPFMSELKTNNHDTDLRVVPLDFDAVASLIDQKDRECRLDILRKHVQGAI